MTRVKETGLIRMLPGPARTVALAMLLLAMLVTGCAGGGRGETARLAEGETLSRNSLAGEQDAQLGSAPESVSETNAYAGARPPALGLTAFEAGRPGPAVAARSAELDRLIARYAAQYDLPVTLVRRVVRRESNFDPAARNGIHWGLMQIRHDTAQTMGYRGSARGLLDAETNLKYAVKYLRGAYITAGGDPDRAVRYYARGYYYDAKRKGLLRETGLRN